MSAVRSRARVAAAAGPRRHDRHTAKVNGAATRARARRALCVRLSTIAARLGTDEIAVLTLVAERLLLGRERYGALRLATDRRDFVREGLEEAADLAVYAAAALLSENARSHQPARRKERKHG